MHIQKLPARRPPRTMEDMRYLDAHTHLQFPAYDADRDAVVARMRAQNVWCINVGTQRITSESAVTLANQHEDMFAAVGLHPTHTEISYRDPKEVGGEPGMTEQGETFDAAGFTRLAQNPKVVAIGECGLDYFRLTNGSTSKKIQGAVFESHLELAQALKKPLMIHCRPSAGTYDAYDDLAAILRPHAHALSGVILHFFVGNKTTAKKFLELGCAFTFGGVITFARAYDEVISYLPSDGILCETDAPYVTPEPNRGKRNEPSYVVAVYKKIAALRKVDEEKLRQNILQNGKRIFGIS